MKKEEMIAPTVNLNGTSMNDLLDQRSDALKLIRQLQRLLANMYPHGRDYFNAAIYKKAVERHRDQLAVLDSLRKEIEEEQLLISNQ
jgi:predicted ABC-class ATPase